MNAKTRQYYMGQYRNDPRASFDIYVNGELVRFVYKKQQSGEYYWSTADNTDLTGSGPLMCRLSPNGLFEWNWGDGTEGANSEVSEFTLAYPVIS